MLLSANELVAGMETPIEMGAHHPRVPASALLLQHSQQSHALAIAMVIGIPDAFRFGSQLRFLVYSMSYGGKPAASPYPSTSPPWPDFTAFTKGPLAGGNMGACLCRQSHRMARRKNEAETGRNFGAKLIT
jgi:hypothetical protein